MSVAVKLDEISHLVDFCDLQHKFKLLLVSNDQERIVTKDIEQKVSGPENLQIHVINQDYYLLQIVNGNRKQMHLNQQSREKYAKLNIQLRFIKQNYSKKSKSLVRRLQTILSSQNDSHDNDVIGQLNKNDNANYSSSKSRSRGNSDKNSPKNTVTGTQQGLKEQQRTTTTATKKQERQVNNFSIHNTFNDNHNYTSNTHNKCNNNNNNNNNSNNNNTTTTNSTYNYCDKELSSQFLSTIQSVIQPLINFQQLQLCQQLQLQMQMQPYQLPIQQLWQQDQILQQQQQQPYLSSSSQLPINNLPPQLLIQATNLQYKHWQQQQQQQQQQYQQLQQQRQTQNCQFIQPSTQEQLPFQFPVQWQQQQHQQQSESIPQSLFPLFQNQEKQEDQQQQQQQQDDDDDEDEEKEDEWNQYSQQHKQGLKIPPIDYQNHSNSATNKKQQSSFSFSSTSKSLNSTTRSPPPRNSDSHKNQFGGQQNYCNKKKKKEKQYVITKPINKKLHSDQRALTHIQKNKKQADVLK